MALTALSSFSGTAEIGGELKHVDWNTHGGLTIHDVTLEQALDDEGLAQTVTFSTEDVAEAMGAFIDKRDPVFRGR